MSRDLSHAPRFRARHRGFAVVPFFLFLLAVSVAAGEGEPENRGRSDAENRPVPALTNAGPRNLEKQIRITVETNAPPPVGVSPEPGPEEKAFAWNATWAGWDGLHLSISQKTRLDDPLAAARHVIEGTNAVRVFRLEELKMSGKIGAKFALDGAAFVADPDLDDFDAGMELRRARVYAKGDCLLVLPVSYQIEVGYIPNEFYIEESYLSFTDIPWIGELKAGQYQAPMGLDVITGSRDITFMEPAAPLQALAPGVNAGIQIGRAVLDHRATWRFGLFTDGVGQDFGEATKDYGRAIVRFTGLPIYQPATDETPEPRLLHLGLGANVLYSGSSSVRYRSRPESHMAPFLLDTGELDADGSLVLGAEVAWVEGPFSIQGEYLHSLVREYGGRVPDFHGLYASASWILTGESRPYVTGDGMFGRLLPRRPFRFGNGGWGAWEVATRFSHTDLNDEGVQGGRLSMLMGGLNWYLHGHVHWRFDYGLGRLTGREPDGHLHVFQTRVEVDF